MAPLARPHLRLIPTDEPVAAFRMVSWSNGFRPVPVKTRDKRPLDSGWTELARRNPPPCAAPAATVGAEALSTGLLCDGLRAVDVDIDDPQIVEQINELARDLLGAAPTRWRCDSARVLLVYAAAEGQPRKRAVSGKLGKVEVLGHGQQFVANGVHPDGQPYEWRDGSPETTRLSDLIAVSEKDIDEFFIMVAPLIGSAAPGEPEARPERRKEGPEHAEGAATAGSALVVMAPQGGRDSVRYRAWVDAIFADEINGVASCPSGSRNDQLNNAAFALGTMVGGGHIDERTAVAALEKAAHNNGSVQDDGLPQCRATIRSGMKAGKRDPRPIPDDIIRDEIDAAEGAVMKQRMMQGKGGVIYDAETGEVIEERGEASGEPQQPLPLFPPLPPAEDYPINELGRVLAPAACAIADKVQVSAAVAGQSVLAAASLAAQAFADVVLPHGQVVPLSLFCVTVAGSGDRKSATDNEALRPVRMREKALRDEYGEALDRWKIDYSAWAAEKRKTENNSKIGLEDRRQAIAEIGPEPEKPLHPTLTFAEITIDGLTKNLAYSHGSIGIFTAEGGTFTGGHSMSDENRLRTATTLAGMWGGDPIVRTRAADGVTILTGRRLSMHLMIQPDASAAFLSSRVMRDQGLLSRLLIAEPESIAGFRPFREAQPGDEVAIRTYVGRLLDLLEAPLPLAGLAPNDLAPRELRMSGDARAVWIDFYDDVEKQLAPGHALAGLKDVASKSAENAARALSLGIESIGDSRSE